MVRNQVAYKFLRNIRGSPPYWQHELHDVLAMLRCIGIPTWFLTLSAADLHWLEMIQAIALQLGRKVSHRYCKCPWKKGANIFDKTQLQELECFNIGWKYSSQNTS